MNIVGAVKLYIKSYSGLNKKCWNGILINFFESILTSAYGFLPLYFINHLKIDMTAAGFIISFYGVGAIIGGYLGGKLSDVFSAKQVLIACACVQILSYFFLFKFKIISCLCFLMGIMGVSSYGFLTANSLWILDQCGNDDSQKLKATNLNGVAANLALGFSSMVISLFFSKGFHLFISIASWLLIAGLVNLTITDMKIKKRDRTWDKEPNHNADSTSVPNSKIFILSLACVFAMGLIIFQCNTTYSIFIKETFPKQGMQGVGWLFAINAFLVVFLAPIVTFFEKKEKVLVMGVGALLLGMSMFMLNYVLVFYFAVIACVVNTIGEILFFSVVQVLCYNHSPQNKHGVGIGLYRMSYALSRVIAPAGGIFIYQHFGPAMLWNFLGLVGFMCLLGCYSLRPKRKILEIDSKS